MPRKRTYSLAELVAKLAPDNQHPEQDLGEPRGDEVWYAVATPPHRDSPA